MDTLQYLCVFGSLDIAEEEVADVRFVCSEDDLDVFWEPDFLFVGGLLRKSGVTESVEGCG